MRLLGVAAHLRPCASVLSRPGRVFSFFPSGHIVVVFVFPRSAYARFFVDLVITKASEFHVSFCAVFLPCFVHFVLMSLQSLDRHAVAVAPHCEFVNFIASRLVRTSHHLKEFKLTHSTFRAST